MTIKIYYWALSSDWFDMRGLCLTDPSTVAGTFSEGFNAPDHSMRFETLTSESETEKANPLTLWRYTHDLVPKIKLLS